MISPRGKRPAAKLDATVSSQIRDKAAREGWTTIATAGRARGANFSQAGAFSERETKKLLKTLGVKLPSRQMKQFLRGFTKDRHGKIPAAEVNRFLLDVDGASALSLG